MRVVNVGAHAPRPTLLEVIEVRKTLQLAVVLLVFTAWAVAQQGSTSQAPQTSSPSQATTSPSAPSSDAGQAQGSSNAPSAPDQAAQPSSGENSIEGCLGGSAGKYTLIDKAGTSYKLELPAQADTSTLDKHIGQEVRVTGAVAHAEGSASSSTPNTDTSDKSAGAMSGKSASKASIKVSKMQKVADTCSTNSSAPPSK